jgi:chromosome segregation ATPase
MVARTASLAITVKEFSSARASVERIVAQLHGYLGELTTESPKDAAQILTATLRIPAPQLVAALTQLKSLGRVEQESQKGEEVSEQHADLVARLKNARATEQRLLDVLRKRTGKVSDVLEVEEQISSVRQDIERMEAEQKNLETRVAYGTVQLRVTEEYKATLNLAPPSTLTSLRNAATDGYQTLVGSLLGLVLWLMSSGPVLIFWGLLLFWPARIAWRRLRGAMQQPTSA